MVQQQLHELHNGELEDAGAVLGGHAEAVPRGGHHAEAREARGTDAEDATARARRIAQSTSTLRDCEQTCEELGDDGDNLATRVRRRLARTRDGVHPQGACWERRLCEATAEWAVGVSGKVQWGLSMRGLRVRLVTAYAAAWRNGRRSEGVRARWRAAAGHALAVVAARARWRRVREWVKEQGALRRAREKAGTATRNVGEVRGTGRGVMGGYSETRQYARRAEKATPVTERRRMRPRPTTVGGVVQERVRGRTLMMGRTPWERPQGRPPGAEGVG